MLKRIKSYIMYRFYVLKAKKIIRDYKKNL